MEIPSTHSVPLSWLYEAASLPIQYRTLTEVVPEPARDVERVATLRDELLHYKEALAIVRAQMPDESETILSNIAERLRDRSRADA